MLEKIKLLLSIGSDDTSKDDVLNLLLNTARERLTLLLGGMEPPYSMDHIIMEVAIIRYNRIGSEGLSSHTVEGESLSFTDDDFAGFSGEIKAFLESQEETPRGRLRFL